MFSRESSKRVSIFDRETGQSGFPYGGVLIRGNAVYLSHSCTLICSDSQNPLTDHHFHVLHEHDSQCLYQRAYHVDRHRQQSALRALRRRAEEIVSKFSRLYFGNGNIEGFLAEVARTPAP